MCPSAFLFWTGERFSPGVGQVSATDEIKREIIHQLSIKPMAHSELVKSLPEDVSATVFKRKLVSFPTLACTLPRSPTSYSSEMWVTPVSGIARSN